MNNFARPGYSPGTLMASRRNTQLISNRQPLRSSLFDQLIEYWPLCEPGDKRIGAILGKKPAPNTGTILNAAGLGSLSAVFGGAGAAFLTLASDADLQLGNIDCTVSCWMTPAVGSLGTTQVLVGKDDAASLREHGIIRTNSSNQPLMQMFNGVSTSVVAANSGVTFSVGNWYHCTATFDHTTPLGSMTVNGTKGTAAPTGSPGVNATAFTIGGDQRTSNTAGFGGQMMRLGIWKRLLTDAEIAYLYNGGRGRDFPWL